MLDPPRQNWALYESMSRDVDAAWLLSLTPSDKFDLYASLFNFIWDARRSAEHNDRLELHRWQQKLELRKRCVEAFAKLDQWRRDQASAECAK